MGNFCTVNRRWVFFACLCFILSGCQSLSDRILSIPYAQAGYLGNDANTRLAVRLIIFQRHIQKTLGATILYGPPQDLMNGGETTSDRRIVIRPGLDATTQFEVLAHEAAHLLQPETLTKPEAEMFAEAVSYETCRALGIVTDPENTARYLARVKQSSYILKAYKAEIRWATAVLTGAL